MATKKPTAKKRPTAKRSTSKGGRAQKEDLRKQVLAKAVVDPKFRRKLFSNPEAVFETKRLSKKDKEGIAKLKKTLPALDDIVSTLAGEVLCGGGGGCGGLA